MLVLPAKTLFKYRAMDYKSFAILLWSLVYWSNSLASKGWTLLALCPFQPLCIMLFRVSPNLLPPCQDLILQPEPSCARRNSYSPASDPVSQGDHCPEHWHIVYAHFFWFYPNQRNKSKGSCQMKNPIRGTMSSVGVSGPRPPGLNDTALVKRITKERGWLRVPVMAPGPLLSLVYYLPRIWN